VDVENISAKKLAEDTIIFGLRMNDGVNVRQLEDEFPALDFSNLNHFIGQLEDEQLAQRNGDFIRLTNRGQLLADAIAVRTLEAMESP
jgi:coproporphyrinogen III oxidase-like Fe-S oxidoreductase